MAEKIILPTETPAIIDIADKHYISLDSRIPACDKCVAENNWDLCKALPDCCISIGGHPQYVYWKEACNAW